MPPDPPATGESGSQSTQETQQIAFNSEFAAVEQAVEQAKSVAQREGDDRSFIAKLIVWSFVILMAWITIAVTAGTYVLGWEQLTEPAKFLMSLLSSVLLPVVTLVIGYYFGKEGLRRDR